jgi:hypothetical protein
MKAEEVFLKIGNEFFNEILTVEEFSKEPDFNIIPKAMREYARIQIEKDRELVRDHNIDANGIVISIDLPINLES